MDAYKKISDKKILLVDDDATIRKSLSLFFRRHGCRFKALESAEEAIDELAYVDYDIVISDLRLDGMDGIEFLERITYTHPSCRKILITAYGSDRVLSEINKLEIDDYIEKPLTAKNLEASLNGLMSQKEGGKNVKTNSNIS